VKIAVVGATGLVGRTIIKVLEERNFPVTELIPVASERSLGQEICFNKNIYNVVSTQEAVDKGPDIALFSAGSEASAVWAPKFAEAGCRVVDNSSYWRMDPTKKLIVPEVNGHTITKEDMIIANPNCSTIQMLVALAPLRKFGIRRIVVSTYQSVTGTGLKAISQLTGERRRSICTDLQNRVDKNQDNEDTGSTSLTLNQVIGTDDSYEMVYRHPIDLNLIPHIDSFLDNGYTKEEMKMVNETHKIFDDNSISISPTTVRVPVMGGHSESVNVEFEKEFTVKEVVELLEAAPGVVVEDDPLDNLYPMPLYAFGKDDVFVGRIRKDLSLPNALNMWIVADNLRKGAATNAVQIAELLK